MRPIRRTLQIAKLNPVAMGGSKIMARNDSVALEMALVKVKERSKNLLA